MEIRKWQNVPTGRIEDALYRRNVPKENAENIGKTAICYTFGTLGTLLS